MKIHLRFDSTNLEHTRMTLFVNSKNTGSLCMSPAEALKLSLVLGKGAKHLNPEDGTVRFQVSDSTPMVLATNQDQVRDA